MNVEREIKLGGVQHDAVRRALLSQGATLVYAQVCEHNQLWDRGTELRDRREVLRVRRSRERFAEGGEATAADVRSCVLTFKGPAQVRGATKERLEIELACTPESEIDALLSALGFVPTFAYEKYREAWALADHEVVLDETPLGCFVEIEGPDPETLLGALELTSARATAASYSELWAAHREENPEASRDMLWRPRSLPGAGSPQRQ